MKVNVNDFVVTGGKGHGGHHVVVIGDRCCRVPQFICKSKQTLNI